ncbi:MAG: RnfABCDGE type electron transport complex subunit B [Oscillospiraceae bacterium]|nr:RnfABCDGE type electron transport complex subunit B [Oscillospiraceae bacterium]
MEVLYAVLILGGIGLILGIALALSSRVFAVQPNHREELIRQVLPGDNCSACGYASCGLYADALVKQGISPDLCKAGGERLNMRLCEILGIEHKPSSRMAVIVNCSGGVRARNKYDYFGLEDCSAAERIAGGPKVCEYGCIGLASCVKSCPFGAISMVEGVAMVDSERCTGCFACIESCPKHIINPIPYYADVKLACSSHDKGSVVVQLCDIGCIGCKACERICPGKAIQVKNNLAEIEYEAHLNQDAVCRGCGDCAEQCPRRLIIDTKLDREPRTVEDD